MCGSVPQPKILFTSLQVKVLELFFTSLLHSKAAVALTSALARLSCRNARRLLSTSKRSRISGPHEHCASTEQNLLFTGKLLE